MPPRLPGTGSSFTINVNLGDGQVHDLALYAVDWDNKGRSEQIQVINAATGAVLDTETLSSFSGGEYLQWAVSGDVEIKVTSLVSASAVVSGLFLDAPPSVPSDLVEINGTDARELDRRPSARRAMTSPAVTSSLPSYATISITGAIDLHLGGEHDRYPRPPEPERLGPHRHHLVRLGHLHDQRGPDRRQGARPGHLRGRLGQPGADRADPAHQRRHRRRAEHQDDLVVHRRGVPAVGRQRQRGDQGDEAGGAYAVVSGVFLDAAPPRPPHRPRQHVIQTDTTTEGNWIGTYGTQGYDLDGGQASLPSYASITVTGANTGTWASTTADLRGLEDAGGSGRSADLWYSRLPSRST